MVPPQILGSPKNVQCLAFLGRTIQGRRQAAPPTGDRRLELRHFVSDGVTLEPKDAEKVVQHLADLWGYEVRLAEADDEEDYGEYTAVPVRPILEQNPVG